MSCIACFSCNVPVFPFANGHSWSKCAVSQIAVVNIDFFFLLNSDICTAMTQPLTSFWTSFISSRSVVVCWFVCILGTLRINKTERNCLYISACQRSVLIQSMASMLFVVERTFFPPWFLNFQRLRLVCVCCKICGLTRRIFYDSYMCNFMIHTLWILSPRVWHRPAKCC